MKADRSLSPTVLVVLVVAVLAGDGRSALANVPPVAEAGLPRYAAQAPVQLDGSGSYDPDYSGPLSYAWMQVSGPPLAIKGAGTATPTISGFVQTDAIQECVFQLIVSDGQSASIPDTVKVVIVPLFGSTTMRLENASFDPNKPTFIYFGGGDCVVGYSGQYISNEAWLAKANMIDLPYGYEPDAGAAPQTYFHYGDMIIAYLSSVAANYRQPIQTAGRSTGGQPAIDVAIRLNLTYKDARYAANHVTFLDATPYCRFVGSYQESIDRFLASPVDGEQCWIDTYVSTPQDPNHGSMPGLKTNVLNVWFDKATDASWTWTDRHHLAYNWYFGSLAAAAGSQFSDGVAAGAYWSVVGPGKNLQLASTPSAQTYSFTWNGDASSGNMVFYSESLYPGRLPEPVTLTGPADGAVVDPSGAVLSCQPSENAVSYQLLFGDDPDHLVYLHSDTSSPPSGPVRFFPFEQTWWTMRAHDRYGSTIHADPLRIRAASVKPQTVQNSNTGQTYPSIQQAINHAHEGDEIVLGAGTWRYLENLDFKGKSLTLRSTDPNDTRVVATTIIQGDPRSPVVTLSSGPGESPRLNGLTITGGAKGVSCRDAVPTIRNCVVETPGGVAIEFWTAREPRLIGCTVLGQAKEVADPGLLAYWRLDETSGMTAGDSAGTNNGMLIGAPSWQPTGGKIGGALKFDGGMRFVMVKFVCDPSAGPFSAFLWAKGGAPGQVLLSQASGSNWLRAAPDGSLMTELSPPLQSKVVITDGAWHRIGLVWDGKNRSLHVDNAEVAKDSQTGLTPSTGGLYIGGAYNLAPGAFWSGLIDDVRIYDRAVKP